MAAPALAQQTLPNIVLVLSDDHSVPYLGCYGDQHIRTPNLDRFASEGMRLGRAFTAAPQCVPSRAAFLTGRSPVAARMGRFNSPLPPDVVTLPELLREKGYFTGVCRRSFHLDGPNAFGPEMKSIMDANAMLTWDRRVDWLDRGSPREQTKAKLAEFFEVRPAGRPFFLWVNFNDPHHAWDRTGAHDPARVHVPADIPDLPGMRDDLARHYDEIGRMDEEFQWVLDELERRGVASNTLVVFAGDNGMAFPRGKGSLYDRGLHVPMLARWPGRIRPGSHSDELVSGEDLTPTFLEAAGIAPLKQMTGRSFLGLLTGRADYRPREAVFGARLYHGSAPYGEDTKASTFDLSRCVRTKRWKLIYNCTPKMEYQPVDSARDAGWQETLRAHEAGRLKPEHERIYFGKRPVFELYDLEADPHELTNLSGRAEVAAVEKDLRRRLAEKMVVDYDFLPLPVPLSQ